MTQQPLSRSAGGHALTVLCLTLLIMTGFSCFADPAASRTPDIYITGNYWEGDIEIPCYWVNGERKELSLPDSVYHFGVTAIAAEKDKVCVVGYYRDDSNDESSTACYWVNGEYKALSMPDSALSSVAYAIAAADGKVYAAGAHGDDETSTVCYWVDGVRTDLSCAPFLVSAITVSDGNVYIAGVYEYEYDDGDYYQRIDQACYWADGVLTVLPGQEVYSSAITVSDGNIYISGAYGYEDNDRNYQPTEDYQPTIKACYWVNGKRKALSLPDSAVYSFTTDISVADGSVYAAGGYEDGDIFIACYWTDGVRTDMPAPTQYAEIEIIAAADGKVYAVGEYFDDNTRKWKACYWIDGVRTDLPDSQEGELYIDYAMVLR